MEVPGSGKPDYFCSTITTHPLVVLKRGVKILVFKSDKMSYTFMKTGCELSVIEELIGDLKKSLTLVDPRDEESFINYYTINEESFQSLIGRQPARESCEFLEIVSATESRQQEEMVGHLFYLIKINFYLYWFKRYYVGCRACQASCRS